MTPAECQVRPATLVDLTSLRLLWSGLCDEQGSPYPTLDDDSRRRWTQDVAMELERQTGGDRTIYLALAEDPITGRPLGFLRGRLMERRIGLPTRYWLVDHLYVIPDARGGLHGPGPQLVDAALSHASTTDVTVLELVAVAGDMQWSRRGWEPVAVHYMTTVSQVARRTRRKPERETPINGRRE